MAQISEPLTRRQRRRPCRRWCCRKSRAKPRRVKSSRKRRLNWAISHISWHIPELRHPDVPVLDVLAVVLGSGRSSRLYQEVREKQGLVNSIDAWTYSPGQPGLVRHQHRGGRGQVSRRARRRAGGGRAHEEQLVSAGGSGQGGQTVYLRQRWPRAKPCRARRRTWAEAGWRRTI